MKKILIFLFLVLAMLFALSACRGDDEESGGDESYDEGQNNEDIHTHTPGEWIVDTEVSCNTNGNRHLECTECHEIIQSEIVYATGHSMSNGVCTVCGKTYSTGLEYASLGGGKCYVGGVGSCTDNDLFIPPTSPEGETVVSIGEGAFYDCKFITGVELSDSITKLEKSAFNGCTSLNNVFLGKNVRSIGDYAFADCESLQSISLGNALTEIGYEAFGYCVNLYEITFPDSLTVIHSNAFIKCGSLTKVSFGAGSKLEKIESASFNCCYDLQEIILPDSLKEIGTLAFSECSSLKNLVIGSGLDVISSYAFADCTSLESVDLGEVTQIDYEAFGYCSALKSLAIPDSVTVIDKNAFLNCTALESVSLGQNSSLEVLGESAFHYCSSLVEIAIPRGVKTIEKNTFSYCNRLERVVIGDGVERIYDYAFANCDVLQEVALGNSLLEIGYEAFGYCKELKSIAFPKSLTDIQDNAFIHCRSLESISFDKNSSLGSIGESAFRYCSSLTEALLPESLMLLGKSAFSDCTSLEKLAVGGENLSEIPDYAFCACGKLTSVEIREGVCSIGYEAFSDCSSLEEITIPEGVERIERQAFMGCYDLTALVLPESLSFLGRNSLSLSHDDRIYYYGSEGRWQNIDFDGEDEYLTRHTPYYYLPFEAPCEGDYWGFDEDGEIVVWGLTADAFWADYYSNGFVSECMKEKSQGRLNLEIIEDEMMDTIILWNALRITSDPTYVFDKGNGMIYKKDLYKYVLYDILTGEHAEQSLYDIFDKATTNAFLDVARMFLGEIKAEDFKIENWELVLKNIEEFDIDEALDATFAPELVDAFCFFVEISENAYEATQYISRYYALRQIEAGYIAILEEIYFNKGNPDDLREAAYELIECYKVAFDVTPEEFEEKAYCDAHYQLMLDEIQDKGIDFLKESDPTGFLQTITTEGKILLALMEPLGIDNMVNSYYKLKCLVALETAVYQIVRIDEVDFYKAELREASTVYMCAVDMIQKTILMQNDYALKFYKEYFSSLATNEALEEYEILVNNITQDTKERKKLFESFESGAENYFYAYFLD